MWDGCERCVQGNGGFVDLSVSGARGLDPDACQKGLIPGVSWQVSDTQVKKFVA